MTQMIIKGLLRQAGHQHSDEQSWKKEEMVKVKEKNGEGRV